MTEEYTNDQQRVCKYLLEITDNQIGCGDDPIGFLIASHEVLRQQRAPDTVTLKRWEVEKFTRRSSYVWSDGGEYTASDWRNEGAIACAKQILETALKEGV